MASLTPAQESALRELAEVTDLVRGYLSTTDAASPADRLWAVVTPRPLPGAGALDEVTRNVAELRGALERLSDEAVPLPATVKISRSHIASLNRDLEGASEKLSRAMGRAPLGS